MTTEDDETQPRFTVHEGGKAESPEAPVDNAALDEEQAAQRDDAIDQLLKQMPMAHVFAPEFPEANIVKLATQLIDEQLNLINTQILPSMVDPGTERRLLVVEVVAPSGQRCNFPAHKRLEGITDPQLAIPQAMVYAFLTTPLARGILRMHGFTYNFMQMKSPGQQQQGPRIIRP